MANAAPTKSATPPGDHLRATYYDGTAWRYRAGVHDADAVAPLAEVLRDKIAEHGVSDVHKNLGLARNTTLSLAAGVQGHPGTRLLAESRLHALARLDAIADLNAAKAKAAP